MPSSISDKGQGSAKKKKDKRQLTQNGRVSCQPTVGAIWRFKSPRWLVSSGSDLIFPFPRCCFKGPQLQPGTNLIPFPTFIKKWVYYQRKHISYQLSGNRIQLTSRQKSLKQRFLKRTWTKPSSSNTHVCLVIMRFGSSVSILYLRNNFVLRLISRTQELPGSTARCVRSIINRQRLFTEARFMSCSVFQILVVLGCKMTITSPSEQYFSTYDPEQPAFKRDIDGHTILNINFIAWHYCLRWLTIMINLPSRQSPRCWGCWCYCCDNRYSRLVILCPLPSAAKTLFAALPEYLIKVTNGGEFHCW